MRAQGIQPESVLWVVMTHMHGDHAGGLSHSTTPWAANSA